jgi:Cu+-exporting ATPase
MNLIMFGLSIALSACSVADALPSPERSTAAAETATARARYQVKGIACSACATRIRAALQRHDGVTKVDVDVAQKIVAVEFDRARTNPDRIKAEIERLGFEAKQVEDAGSKRTDTVGLADRNGAAR